jgi:hypothetical protein
MGPTGGAGPRGPTGVTGPTGPRGVSALWAVVDSHGTLVRGNSVSSVLHDAPGAYRVFFDQDVSNCAYVATGEGTQDAAVNGSSNVVFVQTYAGVGGDGQVDTSFHLAIFC